MLLSDVGLEQAMQRGDLKVDPYDAARLQPSSIDLTLDRYFLIFLNHRRPFIDPRVDQSDMTELIEKGQDAGDNPFILHPGEFVLACTREIVGLSAKIAARVEGKSSLGRLGLVVHSTAGFIDPGFHGQVTLELANLINEPILLIPGMPVAQIAAFQLDQPARVTYDVSGKYNGQVGPTPSRYHLNFTKK
jgi:dCTP deaminase